LGETAHATGRPDDALVHHAAALEIATELGARDEQARAHTGLGHAHHALGDAKYALRHYRRALVLYTDLGMPEADEIRTHFADIDEKRGRTAPTRPDGPRQ
jgi:tetratricopeptide (TPR) repeat protein